MAKKSADNADKAKELEMYRDLVLATLDYDLEYGIAKIMSPRFDEHYETLRQQTEEHYQKGRLSRLKQWFRDLTEMHREEGDLNFNAYLEKKTGYKINIFQAYYERIEKIVTKGKISTDNQYREINSMVDHLCQSTPVDTEKIEILNRLLADYERKYVPKQGEK